MYPENEWPFYLADKMQDAMLKYFFAFPWRKRGPEVIPDILAIKTMVH